MPLYVSLINLEEGQNINLIYKISDSDVELLGVEFSLP